MASREEQAHTIGQALVLAGLFSDSIEAISLVHPAHEGLHSEELLLSQLGIQQSRLLIWGDIVGISSPPASTGITHAVPLHPGAYNPEPDKPVNFGARDARLDERETNRTVKEALEGIVEPIKFSNRHTMLQTYGLDVYHPPQKPVTLDEPVHDDFRLQGFREKHALLRDVSLSFPKVHLRKHVVPKHAWKIHDQAKFSALLTLIRENVDYLIHLLGVQTRVDRGMKLDIRAMGWHPSEDMVRISRNTSKLSLLNQAAEDLYPEYSDAAQEALDNIMDQWKGTQGYAPRPDHLNPVIEAAVLHSPAHSRANSPERHTAKKGGLFNLRPKLLRMFSGKTEGKSISGPSTPTRPSGPLRSNSAWDASPSAAESLDPPRSNSIHGDNDLERTRTYESLNGVLERSETLTSQISRHDMYPGVFRVPTKR